MSTKDALKKLHQLKNQYTLFELGQRLNLQPNTIWRWLKTGKINPNMLDLLERRIKEAGL